MIAFAPHCHWLPLVDIVMAFGHTAVTVPPLSPLPLLLQWQIIRYMQRLAIITPYATLYFQYEGLEDEADKNIKLRFRRRTDHMPGTPPSPLPISPPSLPDLRIPVARFVFLLPLVAGYLQCMKRRDHQIIVHPR